jgi:ferrous iron transport protein A
MEDKDQKMFDQRFTIAGSSLKLLSIGERGVITRLNSEDETILQKLRAMGITLGSSITLEQRFPRFIVRSGMHRFALTDPVVRAIYVRLER